MVLACIYSLVVCNELKKRKKMRLVLSILTSLTIGTSTLHGQEIKKCDGSIILSTKNKAERLTKNDVKEFLLTFGKECKNNVEFSEFSNEVLFLVLDKQTELTLKTIEKEEKKIELNEILDDLNSPMSDMIVVENLISKIEKAKISNRLKKLIVDRLRTAEHSTN
jgi:hypothetical protein